MLRRRKLRPLVITLGGERQNAIIELFQQEPMAELFETPIFSEGVPSRDLRSRRSLFGWLRKADLLSLTEFDILERHLSEIKDGPDSNGEKFFECLSDVPIPERRGSAHDQAMHYSQEFWQKSKGINRGRATLACSLAHLIAIKRLVEEDMDLILEDNVRAPVHQCAERMWEFIAATSDERCHFRYFGWLGSVPNLKWIYSDYSEKLPVSSSAIPGLHTMASPSGSDIEKSLAIKESEGNIEKFITDVDDPKYLEGRRPGGGSPVWGCYAYWVSSQAYACVMERLRSDVGAFLWKTKRARCYSVKPIDKILPRIIQDSLGRESVQLPSHPIYFRAPMLTSKIHAMYDPAFCASTTYQLSQSNLEWSDLWLTEAEQEVVSHFLESGEWQSRP